MSYNLSFGTSCSEPYLGPSLTQVCPGSPFLVFMTILDTFVRAKQEVSRLCERVIPKYPADYYYDFIVIGVELPCSEPYLGPNLAQVCPGSSFLVFMTILDSFIRAKQEISRLCERVIPKDSVDDQYDFIVVGGGSAGAVVASRLSEVSEWKVLLVEAGPDEPPGADVPSMVAMFLGTEIDWQYRTVNESNACLSSGGSCSWPRGKNLGGTSSHNGMMYIRGHAKDYNDWAALGNDGWAWNDVLPYFMCSENNTEIPRVSRKYHGQGGPLTVGRFPWQPPITADLLYAAVEVGYPISEDLNGDRIVGFTVAQTNHQNGVRVSSSSAFLHPVRHRKNLHVLVNATVTKIITDNNRAIAIQYFKNGEFHIARATREIILSGGAVGSPHLLLLSGIGPKEHLISRNVSVVKDLPGVGENLQNHVSYTLSFTINEPNVYDLNWAAAAEYISFQNGPMASTGLSQITGILPSTFTTTNHPDIQIFFGGYQAACASTGQVGALFDNGKRSISMSPTNLHPRSRGTLRLASNNPFVHPVIQQNYLTNPYDVAILVQGIQVALSLANTTVLAKYNISLTNAPINACAKFPFKSYEYWSCAVMQDTGPENHQAGSCKMGPASDPWSVVDPRLRVYGIKGLRVADASIMPKVTSGNTAAPTMMIGERAAAFIKKDWGVHSTQCSGYWSKDNSLDLLRWGIKYLDLNQNVW